jgi:hypothetical protein
VSTKKGQHVAQAKPSEGRHLRRQINQVMLDMDKRSGERLQRSQDSGMFRRLLRRLFG